MTLWWYCNLQSTLFCTWLPLQFHYKCIEITVVKVSTPGADLGGGCRGCAQLVFCKKKETMWFIGVEVEQETSAPPPKKILDPHLYPAKYNNNSYLLFTKNFSHTFVSVTYSSIRQHFLSIQYYNWGF